MEKPNRYAQMGRIMRGALLMLLCFVVFTLMIRFFDVQPIGPNGSCVGFASINAKARDALGMNTTWYAVTQYLGYLALAIAAGFAATGLVQAIERRSLAKVDPKLYALACVYVAVVLFYAFFELVVVNYRPILMDGVLEASYPSSHSMLALTIFGTTAVMARYYIKNKKAQNAVSFLCGLLAGVMVIGRLASGVHWLTDIVGGVILSVFFIDTFKNICKYLQANKE